MTSTVQVLRVGTTAEVEGPGQAEPTDAPPAGAARRTSEGGRSDGRHVGSRRRRARNFSEADRIRGLLKASGWEVRDNRDGSIEVVRARG